jgi:hypothetical protein
MPYIVQHLRDELDADIDGLIASLKNERPEFKDGMMNYVITRLLKGCYEEKYESLNRAMGVLSCVEHEFYRRVIAPYEDTKIETNGDVE